MTFEEINEKIFSLLKLLKKTLQVRSFEVIHDSQISDKDLISFNTWSTVEGYENHIEEDLFIELKEKLEMAFIYDADLSKKNALINWIISELSFENHIKQTSNSYNLSYDETKMNLPQDLSHQLSLFEIAQINQHQKILKKIGDFLPDTSKNIVQHYKLKWLGSQRQLAGLIGNLIMKGWIENPIEGKQKELAESLNYIFDLTSTYKKENPDITENLRHQLKPSISKNGRATFPNCISGVDVFYDIIENNKNLKIK